MKMKNLLLLTMQGKSLCQKLLWIFRKISLLIQMVQTMEEEYLSHQYNHQINNHLEVKTHQTKRLKTMKVMLLKEQMNAHNVEKYFQKQDPFKYTWKLFICEQTSKNVLTVRKNVHKSFTWSDTSNAFISKSTCCQMSLWRVCFSLRSRS